MANLTFSQAQGIEEIPEQSKVGTISKATSAALWHIIHREIGRAGNLRGIPFSRSGTALMLGDWWVRIVHGMIDDAPEYAHNWIDKLRQVFDLGFPHSYDLIQFIIDHPNGEALRAEVADALVDTRAAYRVVDGKIVPFASQEEFDQLTAALSTAAQSGAKGSRSHLIQAGAELTRGAWASAVQECMAAVEGAARFVSGDHTETLGSILGKMRKAGKFKHPALASALSQLYGYTSDEKGIRHSLVLDDAADVTEREAFLMFGLCASFVTYLLSLK